MASITQHAHKIDNAYLKTIKLEIDLVPYLNPDY